MSVTTHPQLAELIDRLRPVGERPWHWIGHWAEVTPDATAISGPGFRWTYRRYDAEVTKWAARTAAAAGTGGVVAVSARKRPDVIAAMVGVMRSGNTLLPLDAQETPRRLERILVEAAPSAVFADSSATGLHGLVDHHPFESDEPLPPVEPVETPDGAVASISYTSGSTGVPKGLATPFSSLLQRTAEAVVGMGLGPEHVLSQVHELSFLVASSRNVFGAAAAGAELRLFDPRVQSVAGMIDSISEARVTHLHCPPQMIRAVLGACGPDDPRLASLTWVRLGTDRTHPGDVRAALRCLPDGCEFIVGYGSTEFGDLAHTSFRRGDELPTGRIPVGRLKPWLEARLLDDDGREVQEGNEGILEVRTRGVIPQPFPARGEVDPHRWVRIGDSARMLADGSLDLVGRVTARVKVDGVAVDLNEVEAVLQAHPSVGTVACAVREIGDLGRVELIAHVVAAAPVVLADLAEHCRTLPVHARPRRFEFLDALPSTARGKVDSEALRLGVGSSERKDP